MLGVGGGDPEQLLKKHQEHRVQMDRLLCKSEAAKDEGRSLMEGGTFMSKEVKHQNPISTLETPSESVRIWFCLIIQRLTPSPL